MDVFNYLLPLSLRLRDEPWLVLTHARILRR